MLNTKEVKRTGRRMLLLNLHLAENGDEEALEMVGAIGRSIKDYVKPAIEGTCLDGEKFIEFGKRQTMTRCPIGEQTLKNALEHG